MVSSGSDIENIDIPSNLTDIQKPKSFNKKRINGKHTEAGYKEPIRIQDSDQTEPSPNIPDPNNPGPNVLDPTETGPSDVDLPEPGPSDVDLSKPGPSDVDLTRPGPSNVDPANSGPNDPDLPEAEFEHIQAGIRRSKRVPILSARKLQNIELSEWHNDNNE